MTESRPPAPGELPLVPFELSPPADHQPHAPSDPPDQPGLSTYLAWRRQNPSYPPDPAPSIRELEAELAADLARPAHAPSTTGEVLEAHKQRMIELVGERDAAPFIEIVEMVARLTTAQPTIPPLPQILMTDLERAERHWVLFEGEAHRWQDRAEKAEAEVRRLNTSPWDEPLTAEPTDAGIAEGYLSECENECKRLQTELATVWAQRDDYLLELQQTRAVVEAAKFTVKFHDCLKDKPSQLGDALAALDAPHAPPDEAQKHL